MTEKVIRHRATKYDQYQNPVGGTGVPKPLFARAVAPGASAAVRSLGRNGEKVDYTVFFLGEVDLTEDDDLEVRGARCKIRILDWQSAFNTGRQGLQVLASASKG